MQVTARGEYAVRAVIAAAQGTTDGLVTATVIATTQHIPLGFLYSIMTDLRRAGLVSTYRGSGGGYRLTRPAEAITIGDVLRSVDEGVSHLGMMPGTPMMRAAGIDRVWASVRAAVTDIVDRTTIADVISDGADSVPDTSAEVVSRSPGTAARQRVPGRHTGDALGPDSPANECADQDRGK
jgi:Rrf2 family protein